MIRVRTLIKLILEPRMYLWVDAILVRESPRAILIIFDGRKAWIPKAWIYRIKRKNGYNVIASPPKAGEAIFIKISDHRWAKKFI